MNPKTCHFIKYENSFLGLPSRIPQKPSRVFGFVRIQDATLVKKSLKTTPFMIQQVNNQHFTIMPPHGMKTKPIVQKKLHLFHLQDMMTSVFFTRVNNVDLILVDEVQVLTNKIHMYSNYSLDMNLDVSVQKQHYRSLLENENINYQEKLEELMIEDEIDDYNDYDEETGIW